MQKHLTFSLALLTLLCTSAHAQLPSYLPSDGLVGWWPFNGNANDESGNGSDGVVLSGTILTTNRLGLSNSAFEVDGVNCPSARGISLPIELVNDNYTISIWSKSNDSTKTSQTVINSFPHNYIGISMNYNLPSSLNKMSGWYGNGGSWLLTANSMNWSSIQKENWKHFVFVKSTTALAFYQNGVMVFSQTITPPSTPGAITSFTCGAISINGGGGCYETFKGKIDDIAIYNRALTPQEIQNLYTATNTGNTVDTGDGAAPLPQGIPYQAAARDAQGQAIVSSPVNVRFSLHEGALDGAVSYSETHALTTNGIGLFNTVFGGGTPEQSAFDSINWAATTKFLQVEIDLGDGYVDMGTTQLLSVPYAFRSDEAARIKNAGLPIFADNTAALAGGLVAGEMYRTATGDLKVVY